jgi:hypothetical protein
MSYSTLVRASRDGDQFHYLWAARRCLHLLSPTSGLLAVTIEGASPSEGQNGGSLEEGEELIDVAEYYGSEEFAHATAIRYIQLKHSTLRTTDPWTWSGLEKTLRGFADRYKAIQQRPGAEVALSKLTFWFISNRPIGSDELETIDDVANDAPTRHPTDLAKLETFTELNGPALSAFCKLLRLEGKQDGYWEQRNILTQEMSGYLPDADFYAPTQLKELVTRKASSEGEANPTITKMDVLRALNTDESRLFPEPCLIEPAEGLVPREQEAELIGSIVAANHVPVIIHAAGGVGKSISSTRIHLGLPPGSACVVYDCFGKGQYRSASAYRHRHKDALVQMANELAIRGLCHPLIPTANADTSAYVRAFLHRLRQSITSIRAENADALLCLVIDAADNAEIAAQEIGESRSFVRDLLREQMPDGVRLVALCRTHRQSLLDPPPSALHLELRPFSIAETAAHLRHAFPNATERDVEEFHWLSSENPRVQSLALSQEASLSEVLRKLGPNPTTVEDTIGSLLDQAIAKTRDAAGVVERTQIDSICQGLAALRPLIPISVLAAMSGVDEAAVRSFAFDLGRPLLVTGDSVQFFDEPAETWFRERFRPKAADLRKFVVSLNPLSSTSAYVASALPQLMLEAGHFEELVAMALSSEGLPAGSPIERRDVELQRLQFALKASLRAKRYTDAVKLALKAGGESAGDERQARLLQANTDLAAVLLEVGRLQEIVSRGSLGSGWRGSHYAYDAGLMSGRRELAGDARSRLRMAEDWVRNWSRLPDEERRHEQVTDQDIAEMAMAHFNIHGALSCAQSLQSWRPRWVSFRAGLIVAARFVDPCRFGDLVDLATAAGDDLYLILAITVELRRTQRNPPAEAVERVIRLALDPGIESMISEGRDMNETVLHAITALVEAAHTLRVCDPTVLSELLTRYLPAFPRPGDYSRYGGSRFPLLRAYSLRSAIAGKPLALIDLAHPELRAKLEKGHHDSQEAREFREDIGALLPWHRLWADTFVGHTPKDGLLAAIADAESASSKAASFNYREETHTPNEIARVWFEILIVGGSTDKPWMDRLIQWIGSLRRPLYTTTLTQLARLAARSASLESQAIEYAVRAFQITRDEREDAETKAGVYVDLARAILPASRADALAYFDEAVAVASKIGDENLNRWSAMLNLADSAGNAHTANPEAAYKMARCAEVTYAYVDRDKHFDWESTVSAIAGLCPCSCLVILSRWRDRDFGWAERLLPAAISFLLERGSLDARDALALVGFRARWDRVQLLKAALSSVESKGEKESATAFLYRYMALDGQSARTWRALKDLSDLHGLVIRGLDELVAFSERTERPNGSGYAHEQDGPAVSGGADGCDWGGVFAGVDLTTADGISQAYRRFKAFAPPWHHDGFFKEAYTRIGAGREAEFVSAVAAVPDFGLYHFGSFLEQAPHGWRSRLAVKSALARAVKAFCRRYCMEISKSGHYEPLSLRVACETSGLSEGEVIDVVLTALGETAETYGARRLFTLVGLLAAKLSPREALDALSFGFDLFEPVTEAKDGDGPWSAALAPPSDIEAALAGYIWVGLAAPRGRLRWEAAHVVRGLCTLRREKVLGHLVALATASKGGPFADGGLYFYDLHARQWLLIALARAAKENPEVLFPHAEFLIRLALNSEPHVLIRGFAARAALALIDRGLPGHDQPDLRERLLTVNVSPFPVAESKRYERIRPRDTGGDEEGERAAIHFGIDFGPYWLKPLGEWFAKSQRDVERAASDVITKEWRCSPEDGWIEDERARRKIFRDSETYESHGSNPRTHDLQFYLSYHAMMLVAGRLLARVPSHRDPDYPEDGFDMWVSDHGLTRTDGDWLADRRDPDPLERPSWKDDKRADDWRWSLRRDDFVALLVLPGRRLNLWGRWTVVSDGREESIAIKSALVSTGRSEALIRALQCSDSSQYIIPAVDDDEIDSGDFQLRAWIRNSQQSGRLDEQDPWAGSIIYPSIVPANSVVDLLDLRPDTEQRQWRMRIGERDQIALWCQVWGQRRERDDDEEPEGGRRLQGSLDFVCELLRRVGMDLIIKVEIERRLRHPRYYRESSDEFGYIQPSARLFLVKPDGTVYTV